MLRYALIFLCASVTAGWADTIFDRFGGTWAYPFSKDASCARNPHRIAFSADHGRATFQWSAPITNYLGEQQQVASYTVLGADEHSITMALDGEQRLADTGAPVVWVLRLVPEENAYCWHRTDWLAGRCGYVHFRCPSEAPNS